MTEPPSTASDLSPSDEVQGGPWIPTASVAAATCALFLGLGLVMVGNGMNTSLLGVRSETEGFGLGIAGLIMVSYFGGFLTGMVPQPGHWWAWGRCALRAQA